jgi:hypothetical protein
MITKAKDILEFIGEMIELIWQTTKAIFSRPFYWHRLNEQIIELGSR